MINYYNFLNYRKDSRFSSREPDVVGGNPNSIGGKRTSWYLSLLILFALFSMQNISAQINNSESFDGTTFVPSGWTNLLTSGTNTWTRVTSGTSPTTTPHSGAGYAKFNSYSANSGIRSLVTPVIDLSGRGSASISVSFWMYRDSGYNTTADKIDVLYNTSASTTGATSLGTINRAIGLSPTVSSNGWYQYTYSVPSSFNGATNYLILRATSAYGDNIYIDDVAWQSFPNSCSGTPTAGTVSPSATQNICAGTTPTSLALSGYTTATGITFQWMQSTDGTTYSNVTTGTGGTTTTYTPAAFGGSTIYYKCRVTCTASSAYADSSPVTVSPQVAPTTQATATAATFVSYTNATATWTVGNGARRVVYISDSPITDPSNVTGAAVLTANTVYAGSGQQIIYDGTAATVSVTGLSSGTTYYIKVYEYNRCGSGPYDYYYNTTAGTNGISITTLAPISSFPFTETFDTTSSSVGAWSVNAGTGATYQWALTTADATYGAAAPAASSRFAYLYVFLSSSSYNTYNFFSPRFNLGSDPKRLKYYYFLGSNGYTSSPVPLALQISVDGGAYTTIYSHTSSNSTFSSTNTSPWTQQTIDLSAYAGHTVQFKYVSNSNYGSGVCDQGLDEITIENIPSCVEPSGLTSNTITYTSANIAWTASATPPANGYDYYVSTSNATPASTVTPTGNVGTTTYTASLSSLTANTTYYFWVRSNCSSTATSPWSSTGSFYTGACIPTSTYGSSSGYYGVIKNVTFNSLNHTTTGYLSSPYYVNYPTTTATTTVSQSVSYTLSVKTNQYNLVGAWIDWNNNLTYESGEYVTFTPSSNSSGGAWTATATVTVPSTAVLGNVGLRVATEYYGYTLGSSSACGPHTYGETKDYTITIAPAPTCYPVTSLSADTVTSSGARVFWTAPTSGTPSTYIYEIRTSGAPGSGATGLVATDSVASTSTSVVLSSLSGSTTYYAYVMTYCGGTDYSAWSAGTSFTTLCNPVSTLPWNENFDSMTTL